MKESTYRIGKRRGDYLGGSTIISTGLFLNPTLRKIAAEPITVKVKKVKEKKGRKTLLTDDQVRAARKMSEVDGKTNHEVAEAFGLTKDYTRALLSYQTRSKVL